ncbi:MutS protein msh4 [Neurospora sp. IMI 360204]|nr:MutS protein msh4 [Neurospora sp. IMI 360204]
MEEDFQARQSRFPRLQSDDCRRRAMSGAAIGGEPRHQAFTTGPALPNDVFIEPRQPLHMTPQSFQRPQLPAYPPAQYDWQDPRGRQVPPGYPMYQSHGQVPPGYPVPLYQSHEGYLPDTHGNYIMDRSHVPLHPVNTHAPHTLISDPRNFSYDPGYGPEHNYYPSSNGNSSGAGHPYLAFENITATRACGPEPGPPQLMPQRRITESPAIEEGPRRDLCSSPYFGNTSASSSPVEPRRSNMGDTLWTMPSKLEKFLVVNSVTNNNSKSLLISCLEQDFPAVPIVLWGREHWSEAEGLRMIERFALRDRVIALKSDLENNFYVSCAFSAYVQNELNIHFASNALRVRYIQPLNTMGIDRTTVASLELLQNTRRATAKKSTLFGILNSTQTPQGHRLLRTTLLQPSTDKEEIEERNNPDHGSLWRKAFPEAGRNAVLEKARRLFKDLTDGLNKYFDMLNNQFNDLCMDSNRRYWLKFDYSDVERELQNNQSDVQKRKFGKVSQWKQVSIASIDIINGTRDKKHFKCQTTELLQRSRAIQLQADIATMQSDNMIIELKERLQQHSSLMFDISDAVALLDMLCSFTQAATTQDYVRPTISDTMVIKQARNPIVEVHKGDYVANDVFSGDQSARFQVITGGNMSGKSTFIRSVALIQIMAQMGSFVPALCAYISICDRVFSRVSTDDAPENNLGTFGVEMRETNVILRYSFPALQ